MKVEIKNAILEMLSDDASVTDLECYTISAVDKAPKNWYNKEQETRKEGKKDGTL